MTCKQSVAARRKARQDKRYAGLKSGDPAARAKREREKLERERLRKQRKNTS